MERRLYPDLGPLYTSSVAGDIDNGHNQKKRHGNDPSRGGNNMLLDIPDIPYAAVADQLEEFRERDSLQPVLPSAPPLSEDSWTLLQTLQSHIMDTLKPPPYSPNDPLTDTDTWEDDLTPDYDLTIDYDDETDESFVLERSPGNANGLSETRLDQNYNPENLQQFSHRKENTNDEFVVRSRNQSSDLTDFHKRSKNNAYSAWVNWRKNVNRQLATVILLRRGGLIQLHKADLSRKPLCKKSMDYVINKAKNSGRGNTVSTSLCGTPYIMYGIPRVVLHKSPVRRT